MKVDLFEIGKDGKPKITNHIKNIWYLQEIVNKYGEENALKLFKIFDYVYNLNPDKNPFASLPELYKFETVFRSTYPELELTIDLEDDMIINALELVGEIYETPKYRAYKTIKQVYERILKKLEFTDISLYKEDGNIGEFKKALESFEELYKKLKETYSDLEQENNVIRRRGGRIGDDRREGGKQKELE